MRFGILGFPKSGKTTLFNILTGAGAQTDRYTRSRGKANIAVAHVPEPRLERLQEIFQSAKASTVTLDFLDYPGLARGEFLGLDLAEFRNVDAILHVARAFEDPEIPHPEGEVDPVRDAGLVELEMMLADLAVIEKRLDRLQRDLMKMKSPELEHERDVLQRCRESLEVEHPIRELTLSSEEDHLLRGYGFLSQKPLLHAVNLDESRTAEVGASGEALGLGDAASGPHTGVVGFCGSFEGELDQLTPEERDTFREEAGIAVPALERVARASYELLDVVTFFTGNEKEVHAWTLRRGGNAPEAAGRVHTDMEKGFIRAEVVPLEELDATGSWAGAREAGKLRTEGRDCEIHEGDVVLFRFSPPSG
jgi:GTP-binding protein YchF